MDGRVDWLTWTMLPKNPVESVTEVYHRARTQLRSLSDAHEKFFFDGQGFDRHARISNFDLCLGRVDNAVRIGGRSPTGHMLFDAGGRACDAISDQEHARRFVGEIAQLLTRFDYAVDIRTTTDPGEFVNARHHKAFRSISYIRSDAGTTAYVGSPKSDRFARVYRYNPPHPRSALLRVEYVFRRGMARAAAEDYCNQESETHFQAKLGNTYGWAHRDWQPDSQTNEKISVPHVDRTTEDTISWLYKQVLPAMRRLVQSGSFDMTHFLERVYNQE